MTGRRCVFCGRPLRDIVPECDSCALRRLIDEDVERNGLARRDAARERVVYWHKRP